MDPAKFAVLIISAFSILLFPACSEDTAPIVVEPPVEEAAEGAYPGVHEDLWAYFDRFESEALERGFLIDLKEEGVTGIFQEITQDGIAGQCNYYSHQPNRVLIDQTFWGQASDLLREFVVFHELGHCSLGRDHREAVLAGGVCASIMRSGSGSCRDNYNRLTREDYLDELFDPSFRGEIF